MEELSFETVTFGETGGAQSAGHLADSSRSWSSHAVGGQCENAGGRHGQGGGGGRSRSRSDAHRRRGGPDQSRHDDWHSGDCGADRTSSRAPPTDASLAVSFGASVVHPSKSPVHFPAESRTQVQDVSKESGGRSRSRSETHRRRVRLDSYTRRERAATRNGELSTDDITLDTAAYAAAAAAVAAEAAEAASADNTALVPSSPQAQWASRKSSLLLARARSATAIPSVGDHAGPSPRKRPSSSRSPNVSLSTMHQALSQSLPPTEYMPPPASDAVLLTGLGTLTDYAPLLRLLESQAGPIRVSHLREDQDFGFAQFTSMEDAERAVSRVNGMTLDTTTITSSSSGGGDSGGGGGGGSSSSSSSSSTTTTTTTTSCPVTVGVERCWRVTPGIDPRRAASGQEARNRVLVLKNLPFTLPLAQLESILHALGTGKESESPPHSPSSLHPHLHHHHHYHRSASPLPLRSRSFSIPEETTVASFIDTDPSTPSPSSLSPPPPMAIPRPCEPVIYHVDSQGHFRGIAFAAYSTTDEADQAAARLQGLDIGGRRIRVEYKRQSAPASSSSSSTTTTTTTTTTTAAAAATSADAAASTSLPLSTISPPTSTLAPSATSASPNHLSLPSSSPAASSLSSASLDDLYSKMPRTPHTHYIYEQLCSFCNDPQRPYEYVFPPSFTSQDRKIVHFVAQHLGLGHRSFGSGDNRYIMVFRDPPPSPLASSSVATGSTAVSATAPTSRWRANSLSSSAAHRHANTARPMSLPPPSHHFPLPTQQQQQQQQQQPTHQSLVLRHRPFSTTATTVTTTAAATSVAAPLSDNCSAVHRLPRGPTLASNRGFTLPRSLRRPSHIFPLPTLDISTSRLNPEAKEFVLSHPM